MIKDSNSRMDGCIRNENPCKDCKRPWKKPGCHDTCPDRKPWLEELAKVNKARKEYAHKPHIKVDGCW